MISQNRRLTMKDNQAKYPQLRFKGFTDPWVQRKLNEVSDIYDGTHQTPKYQDDGVMFLSVENIKTLTSNKFISREAFEDEFKIRPQRGDVLMTRIGDIGTANVVETDEDLAYYVNLALFKSEELNPYFLQASIHAPFVQDQIWKRTLHIAFPKKINKNEIGQVPINVPTLAEQTKVGSFFKQLDDTIALHQRKLAKLKELKQGYLQKMFPQNGSKFPQLRFAGFADAWEERRLKDVVEKQIKGKAQFEKLAPGEVEYLDTSRLNGGQAILTNGLKDVTLDDILILWDGSKAGTVYHGFEGALGSTLKAYRTSANSKFVYQYLKRHQDNIYNNYRTPNIPHVQKDFLNAFTISVPVSDEQEKIGSFFKQLDDTIDLHQRKLEKLQELKKGYLQKMFLYLMHI